MTSNKKSLLFIRVWRRPPIAASVEDMLRHSFPELNVEVFDIAPMLKRHYGIVARNALSTLAEYPGALLSGAQGFRPAFYFTPYLFRQVRQLLLRRFQSRRDEFAFSFQLQSIFDASIPDLPHFVYTDQTASVYRRRAGALKGCSERWIELEHDIYRHATANLTRSDDITRSLIEDYGCPAEKVCRVFCGGNTPIEASSGSLARYQSKEILFVGVDWERKGLPELLEAFAQVRLTHPDARLTVIGCDPPFAPPPGVRFLGFLPVDELSDYYRDAAIYCMPTRDEPFAAVFIEALAHRLPVVATAINAIPEVIGQGHNGLLVPPHDPAAIADALNVLLNDPALCQRFGAASHALYRDRYNWEAVGRRVKECVTGALGAAG